MTLINEDFFQNKQKKRNYLHFDNKYSPSFLYSYIINPSNIIKHSFYPFISYNLHDRKIKKGYIRIAKAKHCPIKGYIPTTPTFKPLIYSPNIIQHSHYPFISYKKAKKYVVKSSKVRLINYASHLDSAIYAYYTELLSPSYEESLIRNNLENTVLAYRKIERTIDGKTVSKCNIHFSKDVFSIVSQKKNCIVLCFDISKFFDNLDHQILKNNWCSLLNVSHLPEDHYKVYKSLTKFASVDKELLYKELGLSLNSRTLHKRHKTLCETKDFRSRVRGKGLISTNHTSRGIPQGSALSGFLSNVYMMQFDKNIKKYLENINSVYFRYSDDMIFIVDDINELQLVNFIKSEIGKLKLTINDNKTQRVVFGDGIANIDVNNVSYNNPSKLQYLGLLYDGKQVFLRDTGISRYNHKLRKAVRMRSAHYRKLKENNNQNGTTIYRKTLHSRFTYIGKRNYISYVFRVSEVHNSKNVKRQVKGHYKLFEKYLGERI